MNFSSDLHTHTIVSGHAYSTLLENINFCAENNIKILGTSEHAPSMPGAPHKWYFANMRVLPRVINGVTILKGCEANIIDSEGNIDIDEHDTSNLDYLIASFHKPTFNPKSKEEKWVENLALEAAMKKLSERERFIINLRFFEGRTQMEVADEIHISQAQVSRLEKSALAHMRKQI